MTMNLDLLISGRIKKRDNNINIGFIGYISDINNIFSEETVNEPFFSHFNIIALIA